MPSPQPASATPPPRTAETVDLIVIHCSATPSGKAIGKPGESPAAVIDRWHAERGFRRQPARVQAYNSHLPSIGYHYVIDLDGRVHTGRSLAEAGAHVAGHNAYSVGVCLVGGAEERARYTQAQWYSLASLVRTLQGSYRRPRVVGHRDLSPDADGDGQVERHEWLKTCPGFDVAAWLASKLTPRVAQVIAPESQA